MKNRATVIILPPSDSDGRHWRAASSDPVSAFGVLQTTLYRVLASQLPMVLVAPRVITDQARGILPHNCLVDIADDHDAHASTVARSVAAGVLASSQAEGWLVLPGDMPMLRANTLSLVSDAVQIFPIAYAQYQARRGHPMGFGKELFSELVHLDTDRDLHRLTSRYPAESVDVDDPGVVMPGSTPHDGLLPDMPLATGVSSHS